MKGTVFFFEDKNESGTNHPWFVISDPDSENNVLIVNCSKIRNNGREDLSCVLKKHCHPDVHSDSYIKYSFAQEISTFKIHLLQNRNQLTIKSTRISEEVLEDIQNGARKTPLLPEEFEKYFEFF